MSDLISGALAMGYAVSALFFLKFWRRTGDRLFQVFCLAFLLLAVQRVALSLTADTGRYELVFYGLRLVAFLLILLAVVDKNRTGRG